MGDLKEILRDYYPYSFKFVEAALKNGLGIACF
jgi:hypothetical protein